MLDEAVSSSMSPLPIRRSAPGWSRMTRLSASEETEKAMRLGMLALITPVITSTEGRWVAMHQVDADGAGHLGDAHDGVLDVAGGHHHEVVELVDHDEDEGQRLRARLGLVVDGRPRPSTAGWSSPSAPGGGVAHPARGPTGGRRDEALRRPAGCSR